MDKGLRALTIPYQSSQGLDSKGRGYGAKLDWPKVANSSPPVSEKEDGKMRLIHLATIAGLRGRSFSLFSQNA